MALQKQLVSYNFLKGIDTKSDEYQVSGKLLELENGVFQTEGEVRKRNGFSTIGSSGPLSAGNAIAGFNDEIIGLDGQNLYSYAKQPEKFINKGLKVAVDVQRNSICKNNYSQLKANSAYHSSGLKLFVWLDETNSKFKYSIIDTETGSAVASDQELASFGVVGLAAVGNFFVILGYTIGVANTLKYISIPISTLIPASPVTIDTNLNDPNQVALCVLNDTIYSVYQNTSSNLSLFTISSTLVVSSATTVTIGSCEELGIAADPVLNQIWVTYSDFGTIKYFVRNASLGSVLAVTTVGAEINIDSISTSPYNGTARLFFSDYEQFSGITYSDFTFSDSTTANVYSIKTYTITNAGSVTNNGLLVRQAFAYSKAFYHGGVHYVVALHESELQNTYFLINQDGKIIAKMLPNNSGPNQFSFLVNVNKLAAKKYNFAVIEKDFVTAQSGTLFYNPGVAEEVITFDDPMVSQTLGNNLHLSGGILTMYDGANVVEHGFNLYPENLGYLVAPYGGSLATTSTGQSYQYSQTYEWTDNQGQLHQSAPSVPISVETPDNFSFFANGFIGTNSLGVTAIDLAKLKIGMKVTGDNIPANTFITSINTSATATLTNNFTASFSNQKVYAVTQDRLVGTTTISDDTVVISPESTTDQYKLINTTIGSAVVYAHDTTNLRVGQTVACPIINSGNPSTITTINGNSVTLAHTANNSLKNAFLRVYVSDSGNTTTWTAGNNFFTCTTPANAGRYKDLEIIYSSTGAFTGTNYVQVISVNTTTGRVTIGGTMTAFSTSKDWKISWTVNSFLRVGNVLAGTGLTGSQTITEVVSGYLGNVSPVGYVKVTDPATSTATSTLTVTNLKSVQWYLPNLCLTSKITNPVILSLWRTELNGSVFFRTTDSKTPTAILYNNVANAYSFFNDTTPDNNLIGNDQLYTTGGVVENIEIPATSIITSYRSRLIGVPSETPYSIWYSKQVIPGNPVEFSDVFVQNIDQKGGPITGLATMDDKLIMFKQSQIYYLVGEGPTSTGINNDFTQPQLISTDSGCINKKSIVITPIGTMYQSAKGIYLLDRSLQVKYIGAEVENYNNLTVTSAQLVSNFNQVRFTLSSGITLMYDYYYQQWSVFTNYSAIDSTVVGASSSASTYYFIQSGGSVKKETNGQYLDDGSYIPLKITTNWFSFAGLQGYERFYKVLILGHYHSPHSLNFKSYYDFSTVVQQDTTITVDSNPSVYQYRMFLNRQKCESVKFTLQDSALSPLGEGFSLSAIAFEVGVKQGLNKMPAAASYG